MHAHILIKVVGVTFDGATNRKMVKLHDTSAALTHKVKNIHSNDGARDIFFFSDPPTYLRQHANAGHRNVDFCRYVIHILYTCTTKKLIIISYNNSRKIKRSRGSTSSICTKTIQASVQVCLCYLN